MNPDSGLFSEATADADVIGLEVCPQLHMLLYSEGLLTSLAAVRIKSVAFRVTFSRAIPSLPVTPCQVFGKPNLALFVVTKVFIRIMIHKSHCIVESI